MQFLDQIVGSVLEASAVKSVMSDRKTMEKSIDLKNFSFLASGTHKVAYTNGDGSVFLLPKTANVTELPERTCRLLGHLGATIETVKTEVVINGTEKGDVTFEAVKVPYYKVYNGPTIKSFLGRILATLSYKLQSNRVVIDGIAGQNSGYLKEKSNAKLIDANESYAEDDDGHLSDGGAEVKSRLDELYTLQWYQNSKFMGLCQLVWNDMNQNKMYIYDNIQQGRFQLNEINWAVEKTYSELLKALDLEANRIYREGIISQELYKSWNKFKKKVSAFLLQQTSQTESAFDRRRRYRVTRGATGENVNAAKLRGVKPKRRSKRLAAKQQSVPAQGPKCSSIALVRKKKNSCASPAQSVKRKRAAIITETSLGEFSFAFGLDDSSAGASDPSSLRGLE